MSTEAPYSYVEDYYAQDLARWRGFPDVTALIARTLGRVSGESVLNPGCGPQFFDYLLKFGTIPKLCVGVDISPQTIRFLENSDHPEFAAAKAQVDTLATAYDLVCADILRWCGTGLRRFDTVVATGFIGTFHDDRLDQLLECFHQTLQTGGQLVKITWHGPHRTPEQTAKKLEYGYDSPKEHDPTAFRAQIEAAGFQTVHEEIFPCDPDSYHWDVIQACVFERR